MWKGVEKKNRRVWLSFCGEGVDGCSVFFQAEDGIRDIGVTGVQTCALPTWFT